MNWNWTEETSRSKNVEHFSKGSAAGELLGDLYGARPVSKVEHELEYGNGEYRKVEIDEDGVIEVEASGPNVLAITGYDEQFYTARTTDKAIHEEARNQPLEWYADPENSASLDSMMALLDSENLDREYGHIHYEK